MNGKKTRPSGEWYTIQGLAWAPNGNEVWFTASESGVDRTLYAVTLAGKERMILRPPGALMLFDIVKDGSALMMPSSRRRAPITVTTGDSNQHDLSWLD